MRNRSCAERFLKNPTSIKVLIFTEEVVGQTELLS